MALFDYYKKQVEQLCAKLNANIASTDKEITFAPRDDTLKLIDSHETTRIVGTITEKVDDNQKLASFLHGNVLGQGCGSAHIAQEGTKIVLILPLSTEMDYAKFEHKIEETVNYLEFWKNV